MTHKTRVLRVNATDDLTSNICQTLFNGGELTSWGVRQPGSRVGVALPNGPELMVRPGRHCSPCHRMPVVSRNEDSSCNCVSMTLQAISGRPQVKAVLLCVMERHTAVPVNPATTKREMYAELRVRPQPRVTLNPKP